MRRPLALAVAALALVLPASSLAFDNTEPLAAKQWYLEQDNAWSFWQAPPKLFPIRVAVIGSAYDLGSVPSLWRKPRLYARFLGAELAFVYKQRLLIVMPNGFGFNWPKHSPVSEYSLLSKIRIPPGATGLLAAATAAVTRLAAAGGVDIAAPAHVTTPAQRNTHDREIILVAVLGALALAAVARYLIRRSR